EPAMRTRVSALHCMIPVSKALRMISRETPKLGVERVVLEDSIGRVLAENIVADSDLPPFDRSQMDGYAVKAADTMGAPITLKLVGESAAGRGWRNVLKSGEAIRIMTGASVPTGADAVQKLEVAREDGDSVTLLESTDVGKFIVPKGKEVKKGKTVLKAGELITPANISIPAAFGYAKVKAAKQPRAAIISTGTEIVDIKKKPGRDQIRNSNSIMLKALCEQAGAIATVYPNVGDDISDLRSQILDAVRNADILVTTGGVSVGKYDLTKLALKELGAEIFFERVALKPGKPTVFGRLKESLVFGLPGNPVSAAVTFYLFVRKAIAIMQGMQSSELEHASAITSKAIKSTKDRDVYLPSALEIIDDGRLIVEPVNWHGSSDFIGFSHADALAVVPKGSDIEAGDVVSVLLLP
ncbi:MAG: molybdopterin molybdotransferase MoeA, partial [bacterium]|nr:molybdopterin molybdotransferase MoeA [bacterium]